MIAEVLIYVPSIANFRLNWLRDRLSDAYTAALVLEATPDVPDHLTRQVLDSIGARAVAMKMGQQRRLLMVGDMPPVGRSRHRHARRVLASRHHARLRACCSRPTTRSSACSAMRRVGGEFVEIIMDEKPLRAAMLRFSVEHPAAVADHLRDHRGAGLPCAALSVRAAAAPDDRQHDGVPRRRRRIPRASSSPPAGRTRSAPPSASLPTCSATSRRCCSRRPGLPRSGSRCRRSTTTCATCSSSAQLFSDRLSSSQDQQVQRFAPKLMRALERAISFCKSTLSYGRAQEPPPDRRPIALEPLVEGGARVARAWRPIRRSAGSARSSAGSRSMPIPTSCSASCSISRATRCRRWRAAPPAIPAATRSASPAGARARWWRSRCPTPAPAFAEAARAHLFEPFKASTRTGGSGLGLVIAAELVRAHDGDIRLVEGTIGATFRVTIPDRAVELQARRGERQRA